MNIHAVLEDGERLFNLLVKVLINGKYRRCVWKLDEILIFRDRPSFFLPTILNIVVSIPSNSTNFNTFYYFVFLDLEVNFSR